MSGREKLHGIVRSVLLEADTYVMPEDPTERAKNLGMGLGLALLYQIALPLLALNGIGLIGALLSDASVTRRFNRAEKLRADQRDGTLSLLVKNKSRYTMRVKELQGGYYTSMSKTGPGSASADSIMGDTGGFFEVRKFFTDMPHPDAVSLTVEQVFPAGSDETADVPVEAKPDVMTIPYRKGAVLDALEQSAERGDFGPLKTNSPKYRQEVARVEREGGDTDRDLGNAPFVAAHALVLVMDQDTGNDAKFYMPVGLNRLMQHTIVIDDKLANKALRKQEKIVRKLKPGEDLPRFSVD
jgi:hypothetical protein